MPTKELHRGERPYPYRQVATDRRHGLMSAADKAAIDDLATTYQPLDGDLTTIAGLTATTNNVIQSVSSAWASRTPTQLMATLPAASGSAQGAMSAADFTALGKLANPVRARVYRSTNQSIAHNTVTAITFDTARVNSSGYTGGTAPWVVGSATRLTVPTGGGGWYAIGAGVLWGTSTGGNRRIVQIRVDGSTVIAVDEKPSGSYFPTHAPATHYQLADASYLELLVYQDSGGALNVTSTGNYSAELWFSREAD